MIRCRFKIHSILALFTCTCVCTAGCRKPNLPTQPNQHLALTAIVDVGGQSFPVQFTWTEVNYNTWDEGLGWHTEWKSSNQSFVHILNQQYAVLMWLPSPSDKSLNSPLDVVLINRNDLRTLRLYPSLAAGERRDGIFQVSQLRMVRSTSATVSSPMTPDDDMLKSKISACHYAYLYGMRYERDEWNKSSGLSQALLALPTFTTFGKDTIGNKNSSPVWPLFHRFNAERVSKRENFHLFGFEPQGGGWAALSNPGVYWCRDGLAEQKGPIDLFYGGHTVDQRAADMFFDPATLELVVIWNYRMRSLDDSH